MKYIYVIGPAYYANWIDMETANSIEEADLVMFTGGADVSPEIYGDIKHPSSRCNRFRDNEELTLYKLCLDLNKPVIGICRGSQFLTALQPNGRLIQDCDNHALHNTHSMTTIDDKILHITSTHHQMMYPFNIPQHELIAWSSAKLSKRYEFGNTVLKDTIDFKEPEIVYYPTSNSLAIQGHPEHLKYDHPTCEYLRNLINEKLF